MHNKNNYTLYAGLTSTTTAAACFDIIASALTETASGHDESGQNIFGRPLLHVSARHLGQAMGLASSGIRASATATLQDIEMMHACVRRHLPVVLVAFERKQNENGEGSFCDTLIRRLAGEAGWIQLIAANHQELVDMIIAAHRIAELTMIPVMVLADMTNSSAGHVTFPNEDALRAYLGDPDDMIETPTSGQKIIFGKMRRRITNWFHSDYPVMLGADKSGLMHAFEAAAGGVYFSEAAAPIIDAAWDQFQTQFGRPYKSVETLGSEKAEQLILSGGAVIAALRSGAEQLKIAKIKAGVANIRVWQPFPGTAVCEAISGKKNVAVLEPLSGGFVQEGPLYRETISALQKAGENAGQKKSPPYPEYPSINEREKPVLFSGQFGTDVYDMPEKTVANIYEHMRTGGRRQFFIQLDFTGTKSSYPKQQIHFQNLHREFPDLNARSIGLDESAKTMTATSSDIPGIVRRYEDRGAPYSRVASFYDRVGFFTESGQTKAMTADPFHALPVIPSATSAFHNATAQRAMYPVLKSESCTGCGQCAVYCPESALPMVALSTETLVQSAVEQTIRAGKSLTEMTPPVIKNLAKLLHPMVSENNPSLCDLLPVAAEKLAVQMKMDSSKKENLIAQATDVGQYLAPLPAVITKTFFKTPEQYAKGSGLIFSLAVDPHACNGCGICAASCSEQALSMQPVNPASEAQLQASYRIWEALPDTPGATVKQCLDNENYNPLAALFLSRHYYKTQLGSRRTDQPAEKIALHLITAAVEATAQARMLKHTSAIERRIQNLTDKLQNILRDALPTQSTEHLLAAVSEHGTERMSLDALIGKLGSTQRFGIVDTVWIERAVYLLRDLKQLYWLMTKGPTGIGRARYSAVISGNDTLAWARQFPDNPFLVPVMVFSEAIAPDFVRGIGLGQMRHIIDNIKLLRRADLELQNAYLPSQHDMQIAAITWNDLTEEEKNLTPPLLLVTDATVLDAMPAGDIIALMNSGLPIKWIVTEPATGGKQNMYDRMGLNAMLFAQRQTAWAHVSPGYPADMYRSITACLRSQTPAMMCVHTPMMIEKFKLQDMYAMSVESRVFPLLRYIPDAKKKLAAELLHLDHNPDCQSDFVTEKNVTFADWAWLQPMWKSHFSPVSKPSSASLDIRTWLASAEERAKHTAYYEREGVFYLLSGVLAETCAVVYDAWLQLREMAGLLSAHPVKLRAHWDAEWSEKHNSALDTLRSEYETKLKQQESNHLESTRIKLRDKLLALSGYQASGKQ